ncbi:MAG TPA: sulfate ABC transporter substrate-binding protein, partial [Candidatus Binataceae bacterium]|nr:sulfate ABC transporter substrate-binding protein [Candidatus Binataceae bacterium]
DGWEDRLPNRSSPYSSTIVFLVRRKNPHEIHDWPDLVKNGVEVIMPDPKTSGNGKLALLAAWGAIVTRGGSQSDAKAYLAELFKHTPFLDPAARMAGVAFAVEKKGDVQLAWENEALRERDQSGSQLEIVYPPVSILAQPSVTWVDANVERDGDERLASEYLRFLYSDEGQEIIARDGYRPFNPRILAEHSDRFPKVNLFEISAIAHSWTDAYREFFGDNGIVDTIYLPKPRTE